MPPPTDTAELDAGATGPAPVNLRALATFLAIAFGLAWAAQLLIAWIDPRLPDARTKALLKLLMAVPLMYPPAVGAVVARRFVERAPLRDLGFSWPRRWSLVAVALALPPLLVAATLLASLPFSPLDSGLTHLTALLAQSGKALPAFLTPGRILALQLAYAVLLAPLLPNALFTFGEELGWRGYLLPRLQRLWGPWRGLWAHGVIWGVWHGPLILLTGYNFPHHPRAGVLLFPVFCALLGAILAWLYRASGSILVPTLAHGSINAVAGLPLVLLLRVDELESGMVYSGVGCALLAVVVAALSRTGSFQRHVLGRGLDRPTAAPLG